MLLALPVFALGFLIRDLVSWRAGVALILVASVIEALGFGIFGFAYFGVPPPPLSEDGPSSLAGTVVGVLAFVLVALGLPPMLVALASTGNTKAIAKAGWGTAGLPSYFSVANLASRLCVVGITCFLFMAPHALRWRLPWPRAKDYAGVIISRWLAIFAAAATWLYVVLLHFEGGPLAGTSLTPLAVLAFGGAALLAPFYTSMIKTFWRHGVDNVLDPERWLRAWGRLRKEFRSDPGKNGQGVRSHDPVDGDSVVGQTKATVSDP